ncbi:hypothetical protein ACEQ8H_000503 [Pleosporales sp. CAS-2024a]
MNYIILIAGVFAAFTMAAPNPSPVEPVIRPPHPECSCASFDHPTNNKILTEINPKSKLPSNLRNAYTAQTLGPTGTATEHVGLASQKVTPARRFVIAPHRHTLSGEHVSSKERAAETEADHEPQATSRPKPRRKFERVESIEEPPKSSPDAPPCDDRGLDLVHTVEHGIDIDAHPEPEDDEDEDILFVTEERNKRRRVSPPTSPSAHASTAPTTPVAGRTHRFVVPPPRTPASLAGPHNSTESMMAFTRIVAHPTPATHRPAFILPPQPTSPQKPSKPLPEIFSPSRKSQKYVPNGLAATMQGWIIETANTGFAAQEHSATGGVVSGRAREDGVKVKVCVKAALSSTMQSGDELECFPGHFVFVRGETEPGIYNDSRASALIDNNGQVQILLAGQGSARGSSGVRIRTGCVVGLRAPIWHVDVEGEAWMVGVEWVVLS